MAYDYSQFNSPSFQPWAQGIDLNQFMSTLGRKPQPAPAPQAGTAPAAPSVDPSADPASTQPVMPLIGAGDSAPAPAPQPAGAQPQQSRAGRLHDKIVDILTGGTPPGYEGILTPEEIRAAKPSLLHSLIHGTDESATSQYQNNLNSLVGRKMFSAQAQRAQQLAAETAQVDRELGPAPGDAEGFKTWARRAYGAYSSIGNIDRISKLNTVMQQVLAGDINKKGEQTDLFYNPKTNESRYIDKSATSVIPPDFHRVNTAGGSGGYTMFVNPKAKPGDPNARISIQNGDNDALSAASAKGFIPESTDLRDQTNDRLLDNATKNRAITLQKQYVSSIAPLRKNATGYDKALATFDAALHSPDPQERRNLFGALYSQYVQNTDQSNNLRFQLLQYYTHHIDPSVAGTAKIFWDKFENGKLPDDVVRGMVGHIERLRDQSADEIESQRSEFLDNNPGEIGAWQLPHTSTMYQFAPHTSILDGGSKITPAAPKAGTAPAPASAAALYKKYDLAPRNP